VVDLVLLRPVVPSLGRALRNVRLAARLPRQRRWPLGPRMRSLAG
jgi:hypothetical protein